MVPRQQLGPPRFVTAGAAGRRRRRDRSVPPGEPALTWVDGAHALFIGKAATGAEKNHGLKGR
ncbi:hypothetical protein AB0903_20315 [Streptomyces sp. NPDC048389]|uniref:hypothetical protein n=1 Tax=Streptomyces sp. NPDC048389 TaxID=3154622 RepID=UPI003451D2E3